MRKAYEMNVSKAFFVFKKTNEKNKIESRVINTVNPVYAITIHAF